MNVNQIQNNQVANIGHIINHPTYSQICGFLFYLLSVLLSEVGRVSKSCTQVKVLLLYNNSDSSRSKSTHHLLTWASLNIHTQMAEAAI